jgi:hypothetical protein
MAKLASSGGEFDLWEFYLHEAMAQLHLSLFGESTEFSENHNVKLREAYDRAYFGETSEIKREANVFIRRFAADVMSHSINAEGDPTKCGPLRAQQMGCPVFGPVAAACTENMPSFVDNTLAARRDTMTIAAFAGFDTTANMMTWMTFEMCRRPELQVRITFFLGNLQSLRLTTSY